MRQLLAVAPLADVDEPRDDLDRTKAALAHDEAFLDHMRIASVGAKDAVLRLPPALAFAQGLFVRFHHVVAIVRVDGVEERLETAEALGAFVAEVHRRAVAPAKHPASEAVLVDGVARGFEHEAQAQVALAQLAHAAVAFLDRGAEAEERGAQAKCEELQRVNVVDRRAGAQGPDAVARAPDRDQHQAGERKARARGPEAEGRPEKEGNRQIDLRGRGMRPDGRVEYDDRGNHESRDQQHGFGEARKTERRHRSQEKRHDSQHRGCNHGIGHQVRNGADLPQVPVRGCAEIVQLHERAIEERRRDGGDQGRAEEEDRVPRRLEGMRLADREAQETRADERLGYVAYVPAEHHRERNAGGKLGGEVRGKRRREHDPPIARRDEEENCEEDRIGRPQHRDRQRLEREGETEASTQVVAGAHQDCKGDALPRDSAPRDDAHRRGAMA
jgi:hypothetical protein